jgi:hypothetical protein
MLLSLSEVYNASEGFVIVLFSIGRKVETLLLEVKPSRLFDQEPGSTGN